MKKKEIRIVFMGTPEFAVPSLAAILEAGYKLVGVITAPDKPAGRGKKLNVSAVKRFSLRQGLNVLQPVKLKDENFINELRELKADLQVVVAFRMLPEKVWAMPPLGTFNLHASLLPQYRGAAPINHAIINGEKSTGLTTFFLDALIDTGTIIQQQKIQIGEDENAGSLHDRMMIAGAGLVVETIELIRKGQLNPVRQSDLLAARELLHPAPKIFKADCQINWEKPLGDIHNFVRGLSPYPAAFTTFVSPTGEELPVKIFKTVKKEVVHGVQARRLITDGKQELKVAVQGGYLYIIELQRPGKKRMPTSDFLRGNNLEGEWSAR
ncbi:MAG: methionyl-tRNA formyltransferase [Bacteroidales bacterium]|nr:methionyl-tRNA formyltransferase [Bacteroidales bacterium]